MGLALFGSYQGLWNTVLETLFADSTDRGDHRAKATTKKFGFTLLATTAGPALAIVLFFFLGDAWSLGRLTAVLCAGLALCAPPVVFLLRLDDVAEDRHGRSVSMAGDEKVATHIPYVVLASDLISGFG